MVPWIKSIVKLQVELEFATCGRSLHRLTGITSRRTGFMPLRGQGMIYIIARIFLYGITGGGVYLFILYKNNKITPQISVILNLNVSKKSEQVKASQPACTEISF